MNSKNLITELSTTIESLKKDEVTVEKATAIAKLADKINKNNMNEISYKKLVQDRSEMEFFKD